MTATDKTNLDKLAAIKAAFPNTLPVFAGFTCLGVARAIFMITSGFPFWYPILTSVVIFAGSMEFVAVDILLGSFNPLSAFLMTLMINARHLFYGVSMLEKYKGPGLKKPYLIFGMCDESFSVNCTAKVPSGVDKDWFMFFVTLLNQLYWILGSVIGSLFGGFITFNTEGIDFVMTAMFVVILLEQCMKKESRGTALLGLGLSLVCLIIFGADSFIIPSMLLCLLALSLIKPIMKRQGGAK